MDRQSYRQTPSRPQQSAASAPTPAPTTTTSFAPPARPNQEPSLFKKFWWTPVVLVVLLLGAWWFFGQPGGSQVNGSKYQAVFLNNGQVYFGKLKGYYTDKPVLTDVYYIQAEDGGAAEAKDAANSTQQLIKLGKEIHGPENKLLLNPDAILFVENLNDESEVVKVIKEDNKQ